MKEWSYALRRLKEPGSQKRLIGRHTLRVPALVVPVSDSQSEAILNLIRPTKPSETRMWSVMSDDAMLLRSAPTANVGHGRPLPLLRVCISEEPSWSRRVFTLNGIYTGRQPWMRQKGQRHSFWTKTAANKNVYTHQTPRWAKRIHIDQTKKGGCQLIMWCSQINSL
jgi:hypothetical protein